MKNRILEEIVEKFSGIGDKEITGHEAAKIVGRAMIYFTTPKDIEVAKKYVSDCNSDMGFMGSPEYEKQKKVVEDYNLHLLKWKKDFQEYQVKSSDDSMAGDDSSEEFQEHQVRCSDDSLGESQADDSDDIRLQELERKLDEALGKETKETLSEWIEKKRSK